MEFSHEYFDDEVREDFYVSGLMKRLWAANLEVISDVAKVCDKYNIRWFADYGTLLGAVRHGGCIPWDDDFDICMLRGDYMRFLEVAEKELPQNYSVLNCHNEYEDLLTRVINTRHLKKIFYKDIINVIWGQVLTFFRLIIWRQQRKNRRHIRHYFEQS